MVDSLIKNESVSSFSISKYLIDLILPKSVIVHGELLSSVYLQIALHINNEKNVPFWKKNSCWMSCKTISKNVGCNVRTVQRMLVILMELDLIEESNKNKLKIYKLKNHLINTQNELENFNKIIEQRLLTKTKLIEQKIIKQKFRELNKIYPIKKEMLKKYWFFDINNLRQKILHSEYIYKGSTLFYLKNIATLKDEDLIEFSFCESENLIAIKCGCSQSTVSRYINAYVKENFLKINKNKTNNLIEFKKNNEGVVNDMSDVKLICPICNRTFLDQRSLGVHISKSKDMKHKLLNNLKKQTQTSGKDIFDLYKKFESDFNDLNEFSNFENNNQESINDKQIKNSENKASKKINSTQFVKYFYDKINSKCSNYSKECTQVKNAIKKGYSPEEITLTMDYLIRKGNIDLRFFNRSIDEALLENKHLNETNVEGTASYLVKMYYDGLILPLNMQTFTRDIQKVKETMNTGLSYEQTKIVIQYMIDIKCPTLNFIGSKTTEALTKHSKLNAGKNNPCFYDRNEIDLIRNQLIEGKITLRKISNMYKSEMVNVAKEIFLQGTFAKKYNHFEWAWKIGLELNEEMYIVALNNIHKRESLLDKYLKNPSLDSSKKQALLELKSKFNVWLSNLDAKYAKSNINNY